MTRKRLIVLIVVAVVLGALIYLQIRTWRRFDWPTFAAGIKGLNPWRILAGVLLIYLADFLRAIRWKIFLKPSRPAASWTGLIAPQYIGFTALAIFGRLGELIRPYLIARREKTTFSSQLAIWLVERVFDVGAVTLMLSVDIFFVRSIRENYPAAGVAGYVLLGFFVLFAGLSWLFWRYGVPIGSWICRRMSHFSQAAANAAEKRIHAFSQGMNTIHSPIAFFQVSVISIAIWLIVGFAYVQVIHGFPSNTGIPDLELPEVTLLMGASIAGGALSLPILGGGSQLATIFILSSDDWFGLGQDRPELAVACGMLLWLVTFVSVVPLGFILARREHISLRKLSAESEEEVRKR